MIRILSIVALLFFGSAAQANFEFSCNAELFSLDELGKIKSKDECIKAYTKRVDETCCVNQSGEALKGVAKPSELCQINAQNTSCRWDGGAWSCFSTSAVCNSLSKVVGFSDPPQYSCENKTHKTIVFVKNDVKATGGMISLEKTKPIFCLEDATEAKNQGTSSQRPVKK